jgi:hypothetical protein
MSDARLSPDPYFARPALVDDWPLVRTCRDCDRPVTECECRADDFADLCAGCGQAECECAGNSDRRTG